MAHTPGPWRANATVPDIEGYQAGWHIDAHREVAYIDASTSYYMDAQCQANARLIAAAPLMLEELEYVASGLAHIDTPWATERLGFVQEVIKQAKGE